VPLIIQSFKLELQTGGKNSLQLAACKFDRIGENLLTARAVLPVNGHKRLPVAPVPYADRTIPFPELAWDSK
jgi:hypothetical protein